jgi:PAS domain S-box-containing protein
LIVQEAPSHTQETTILGEIWQNVLPHLSCPQRVLEELTGVFQRSTQVSSFNLFLLDTQEHLLHSVASWNVEQASEPLVLGEGTSGYVAQTGELCNVSKVIKERSHADAPVEKGQIQVYSELAVPLAIEGDILGVMVLRRERQSAFSQEDETVFTFVAQQVAYALHYAIRHDELAKLVRNSKERVQEQTQQMRIERDRADFLYQVTQEMTRSLELERVLNRTLARVSQAVGVQQGSILLLDSETGYLVYRAALGRAIALPKGGKPTRFKLGVGLAGWVLEHNESATISGIDQDPRWETDPEKEGQSESVLAVPLSSGGKVLGVMLLFHPNPEYFNEDHTWLAMAAANHITAAIKNTELYRMIRDQATRLGSMLRAQSSIASQRMAILSSIADGVVVSDEHDRITVVNDAARRLMHLGTQELIGQPASALFGDLRQEVQQAALQAMAQVADRPHGRQYVEPVSIVLAREKQIIQASFTPMVDERQQFVGTVIVLRDITQEQEVAQAKNEFISIVAHELRTPMTSIKGYTDLMLQGAMGELSDGQQHFLTIIKSNVDRLATLVNDMLDISRIEAGRIRLELASLQLEGLVREVCDSVAETIRERGLTLDIHLPTVLPAIDTDRNRVIQVLVNLLSNAYRYTPTGGTITVSAYQVDGAMQVDVADTGIGIAEKDQEKIFEAFYRADHPMVNQQTGTGLGLPIVRSLIQKLGGKLWLQSELGKGSTFSFTLPLCTEK